MTAMDAVRKRVAWPGSIALFAVLPSLLVLLVFANAIEDGSIAMDFHQFYGAAERILDGESPYAGEDEPLLAWGGPYPYPPLPALLAMPLTLLPFDAAGLLLMALLVLCALATLYVLEVRDWRLYGLIFLWPPVLSAVQTSNLTLPLGLAAALAWRYRERTWRPAVALGLTLAAKFFLWPLVVWLAATRRLASALLSVAVGGGLLLASWAVIGFDGMLSYPDLVQRLEDTVGADSYTLYIVGLDAGLPHAAARAAWLLVGVLLLAAVVVTARRHEDRRAFVLAVAASLALTPIVWLHYFALFVVMLAVASPRLSVAWLVPLGMVLTPGSGQPSPFETAWTLLVAAATVALALQSTRPARERLRDRFAQASASPQVR